MTELGENLQRRLPVQAFSGSHVQALGNRIQFARGVARQHGPLGEVLAPQPIGILIGPALPRTMRGSKEHAEGEPREPSIHAQPSLCLEHRSTFSATGQGCVGASWQTRHKDSVHSCPEAGAQ